MELLFIVLAPFLLALVAPLVARALPRHSGWVLAALPAALFLLLARHLPAIAGGATVTEATPWVPQLGVALAFNLDGFSLLFALLILGIGALIVVYGGGYLAGARDVGRFHAFLLMFMGSMLGIVLADDLIALFVFWELTSLSSFFLIGYHHEEAQSRTNAMQALLVTAAGGLAFLAGAILLGNVTGTMRITEILAMRDVVQGHPHYHAILVLFLAGAFTKSAQFPFHFWLPNAMVAPTPVSAYLHSATMVKAGVYLLARTNPVLGGTAPWTNTLVLVGAVTMLLGAYLAFRKTEYKRILAYTTLSSLGILVLLLGIGTALAIKAAVVFLLVHALYKGAFFLVAGAVDHGTGEREVPRLGGLARAMPLTATAAVLAGLSLAGLPPLFAFIAKETILEATLAAPVLPVLLTLAAAATAVLFVAVAGLTAHKPFFGPARTTPHAPHEAPPSLLVGPLVLAGAGVVMGLVPALAQPALLGHAASAIHAADVSVELAIWHGINPSLLISLAAIAAGILLYLAREPAGRLLAPLDAAERIGPERGYHRTVAGLLAFARGLTGSLQTTHIHHYFKTILLVAVVAAVGTLLLKQGVPALAAPGEVAVHEGLIAGVIVAGSLLTAIARSRLTAIIALGLVGFGVALVFILFGAPDLALTQFLFETLIVILFTFVLIRMPRFARRTPSAVRARDIAVAAIVAIAMTTFALAAAAIRVRDPISTYFAEQSYLLAHGRNVVNVILVDFRGLDTLGEITVIAVAAIGAYALLAMRRHAAAPGPDVEAPGPQRGAAAKAPHDEPGVRR